MQVGVFEQIKSGLSNVDPVAFCEKSLTLDGKPFRLHGNGFKPFAEIYRYIGINALQPDAKPVILVKGRQVGATIMAGALTMYFMTSGLFGTGGRAPMRMMHAFPTLVHVFKYAKTKLNPMIKTARLVPDPRKSNRKISCIEAKLDKGSGSSDSLQYKQFENANWVSIESTGLDADRLRGGTLDAMFYDEIQDIPKEALANANKLLTAAQYGHRGVKVYFGTPKQKGSEYYKMWEKSNQQYYHLGCENCGELFQLYTPGSDSWEKIWLYGKIVRCPHCEHTQNKLEAAERGEWVPTKTEGYEFVGYHINQLYTPWLTREDIDEERPENSAVNTERAWHNEVLGEFYAGEMGPITMEEILEKCSDKRAMRSGISRDEGKKVFAGFDWGKKGDDGEKGGGQSYSTAVVLTEDGPNRLLIDFATILKKNDNQYKRDVIHEVMRKYSVTQAVGDIGYAHELTEDMQREYGERFLSSRMCNSVNGYIKMSNQDFPKEILAEREYHLHEIFNIMKRGMIRFPLKNDKSFEQISWLIEHCCSMEVKITFNVVNEPVRRFVKGATPNDGLMALLNAYLAYKYYITGGFNNAQASIMDKPGPKKILAVTGYCPRF